jgi:hypothetical protein
MADVDDPAPDWPPKPRSDWRFVEKGGVTDPGIVADLGRCPGMRVYTVRTQQTFHPSRPNSERLKVCLTGPPRPAEPSDRCADDCLMVRTHIWHGWTLSQNVTTRQWLLNCYTFAQYRCRKPGDPKLNKPPKKRPPKTKKQKKRPSPAVARPA